MTLSWHRSRFEGLLARKERLPHAILVRGPEGIGKLAFATALAQALLCERPGSLGEACGKCPACAWLAQGSHPDFRLVAPARPAETAEEGEGKEREKKASLQIDVDQVRELEDFLHLTSHRGVARVVLIHPAEALNIHAANALLKNLEEPPPQTWFLLVAHRWNQILPTIRSRCQNLSLPLPEAGPALEWLRAQGLAKPELALAQAGGAPLLATRFDEDYWQARDRLLDLIGSTRFDALGAAEALKDVPPATVVGMLQRWSFDLVLQRATGKVRYNPDRAKVAAEIAQRLDGLATLRFHRWMVQLQRVVHHPLNARLFLEDVFLAYAELLRNRGLGKAA